MNDEQLTAYVLLAKNGDTSAFCKLYELYYKDMYRFAYYMLGNTTDAEDVISDTVLDAFTGIKKLRKPESFKAWIFQILSKKCKQQLAVYINDRKHRGTELEAETLSSADIPHAENIDVLNAYDTLSTTEKMVVSFAVFAGYNSKEIAKIMDSREGTIRSIKSRALAKMSNYIKEDFA